MSLRAHLVALVVAALLPVIVFSGFVVVLLAREQQTNVQRGLRETTRALALAVEGQLRTVIASLEVLGASEHLGVGDLRAFHRFARRVVSEQEGWILVGLASPTGEQLVNTERPFGTPLPWVGDAQAFQAVMATGRPAVSDLVQGRVSGRRSIVVGAPVRQDDRLRFVVFVALDPQSLVRILEAQRIAYEWTGAILDRHRVIIARSRAAETMIGRPATPKLAAASREAAEGTVRDVTQEGEAAYATFSRLPRIDWAVVLGVPAATVTEASRRALWLVGLGGLAFLVLAAAGAMRVGRRIAGPMGALADAAAALGRGERPAAPVAPVTEVDRVGREIEAAALERERAERRMSFLAEASRVLASSLDYEATFQGVASLTVGELCDLCVLDLAEPDGSIRRVAVAHADPTRMPVAERLKAYPPDPVGPHPVTDVIRSGRPARITLDETVARDATHLAILRQLDVVSILVVPLEARGRTLGAISLGVSERRPPMDAGDLALAGDLGRRAGVAVDNARLYREAQEAIRIRDEFLARASHELRTPLTSAVATLKLLERAIAGHLNASPEELIAIGTRNVDAMLGLINNLLDASKLAAGEEGLTLERVDLERLVTSALDLVAVQGRDKGIEIRRAVAPGTTVLADRLKLEQVLVNLVVNAIKFTPAGGAVIVEAGPEPGPTPGVVIRVRDTGEGIAPEHLDRIFEPFFQAHLWGGGRASRGTGLGLAICRQIVTLHGGRISAESGGPGSGSTFVVRLPATPPSRGAA